MSRELFVKIGKGLFPSSERAEEIMHGLPEGRAVMVSVDKPRNPRQHNLYWALVKVLMENCDEFKGWSRDAVSKQLKIDCGAVDWMVHKRTGMQFGSPQSIRWESMPQDKFKRFFDRAIHVITTQYIPNLESAVIREQVEEMVDGKRGK